MNDEIANVAADSKAPDLERTGASPEAIISHYDKGEDFLELVLGPELIYSCALFEGDDDLAEAQRRKLDYHIEAANAAFTDLVDATRHNSAQRYLTSPQVTLSKIAYLLDYADESTFFRASHRWFGESAGEYRARVLEGRQIEAARRN